MKSPNSVKIDQGMGESSVKDLARIKRGKQISEQGIKFFSK